MAGLSPESPRGLITIDNYPVIAECHISSLPLLCSIAATPEVTGAFPKEI
jgi:hypothetical protein